MPAGVALHARSPDGAKRNPGQSRQITRSRITLALNPGYEDCSVRSYAATTAGIGSAVTDLIFSIAKREVTFFSGTALISFL